MLMLQAGQLMLFDQMGKKSMAGDFNQIEHQLKTFSAAVKRIRHFRPAGIAITEQELNFVLITNRAIVLQITEVLPVHRKDVIELFEIEGRNLA